LVIGPIIPNPIDKDKEFVFYSYDLKEMDKKPNDPGEKAFEFEVG